VTMLDTWRLRVNTLTEGRVDANTSGRDVFERASAAVRRAFLWFLFWPLLLALRFYRRHGLAESPADGFRSHPEKKPNPPGDEQAA
jgi:hypothetical protein